MPTENMQVAASTDDAEQGGAAMLLTGPYIRWYQGANAHGGFRFVPESNIPIGADITSATFSHKYTHTDFDTLTASVWAEDGATPGTFTDAASDISNRAATTETAAIDDTNVGTDWQEVDVTAIVQELADSYTIQAIAIIVYDATSDTARTITWDGDSANCPKLDIVYTAGADFPPVPGTIHRRHRHPHLRM